MINFKTGNDVAPKPSFQMLFVKDEFNFKSLKMLHARLSMARYSSGVVGGHYLKSAVEWFNVVAAITACRSR